MERNEPRRKLSVTQEAAMAIYENHADDCPDEFTTSQRILCYTALAGRYMRGGDFRQGQVWADKVREIKESQRGVTKEVADAG